MKRIATLVARLMLIAGLISSSPIHSLFAQDSVHTDAPATAEFRVMTWNIWHGGREDGEEVGPLRVAEVIRDSQADVVAMQETYGSGERIAEELSFHFQPRGTNVSILSRYPIIEDISVFDEFKCVGGLIELPTGDRIAFYSIWLPYAADIWLPSSRESLTTDELQAACQPSANDLASIHRAIQDRLADDKYRDVSIVIAGDFNSMSHLDYRPLTLDQYGTPIDWHTSHVLIDAGFRDAYREARPTIDRAADATWSPRFPEQEQDRIDFVYYRSAKWRSVESQVIRDHAERFPSDHGAVVATFQALSDEQRERGRSPRVASYNVRRGFGMDNRTNLTRTADTLRGFDADLIGLQEIDVNAERSGVQNQAWRLGQELGMHSAFAKFLDFQGGQYGLAILSRYPIQRIERIELPEGNEPRTALAIDLLLPDDTVITAVNIHFDWVRDDGFRFQQAERLHDALSQWNRPFVLTGDFNDQPGSRTIELFRDLATEADKPMTASGTYPANKPEIEIDFIFAGPSEQWEVGPSRVVDEPVTSDHRPVLTTLRLK